MGKYRKLPVEIEAFKWTGDKDQEEDPEWAIDGIVDGTIVIVGSGQAVCLEIKTPSGVMKANSGDYVIKGVKGELYPCKPDVFEMTYEKVADSVNGYACYGVMGNFLGFYAEGSPTPRACKKAAVFTDEFGWKEV